MISSLFKTNRANRPPTDVVETAPHAPAQREAEPSHQGLHSQPICECDICLRHLVKYFDDLLVVDDVSFHLMQGELMALLGPSGCGKTTTLRMIAGFERLDGGEIEISQQIVAAAPDFHLPPEKRRIGMVFQEYALFPHLSVAQNIQFGLHNYPGDVSRRTQEVLDLVGLDGYAARMPHELSGGQQQRVALARALAPEPNLILLDEPFSNLDAGLRTRVRAEVRAILQEAGATAIFVTHDQEEALSLVDQVAVLMDGRLQQVAPPHELYSRPINREVASFVGEANFLPGSADGKTVTCELGTLPTSTGHRGSVDVMIRPENITIRPAAEDAPNHVRHSLFFGHDQLVTVQLGSGRCVDVRLVGPHHQFHRGDPVDVSASGPVMTFPE